MFKNVENGPKKEKALELPGSARASPELWVAWYMEFNTRDAMLTKVVLNFVVEQNHSMDFVGPIVVDAMWRIAVLV